jgi:hypothetical protein
MQENPPPEKDFGDLTPTPGGVPAGAAIFLYPTPRSGIFFRAVSHTICGGSMSSKRRRRFLEAVAAAARVKPTKPRGRPMLGNLTIDGRAKGLEAIRAAPRCRAERRSGGQCRNPAMKGATRCLKHGGRVEVPGHPHNLRRFFEGPPHPSADQVRDREGWDRMTMAEQRELIAMLPSHIASRPKLVRQAARVWREVEHEGYRAWARLMADLARA